MDDGSRTGGAGSGSGAGRWLAVLRRPGVLVGVLVGLVLGLLLFGDAGSAITTGALAVVVAIVGGTIGYYVVGERRPRT